MTECDNAEIRDVLPDYVAESLSAAMLSRVTLHLAECAPCREEVTLLRVARAARPQAVHLDIDAIVARLGKPGNRASSASDPIAATFSTAATANVTPVDRTSPAVVSINTHRPVHRRSRVWQMAAAIGVVVIGGWSAYMVQGRGFGMMSAGRSDSARIAELAERGLGGMNGLPSTTESGTSGMLADARASDDSGALSGMSTGDARESGRRSGVVSVGDLSDYTDAELQRMLDRLDKWDGATSGDVLPTMPIVPVGSSGSD